MRYEEIQRRAKEYHEKHRRGYVHKYDAYLASLVGPNDWRRSHALNSEKVINLIGFLNEFRSRYPYAKYDELRKKIEVALPWLKHLDDKALLDVDFKELIRINGKQLSVGGVMKKSYNTIDKTGFAATTTSKILHVINPELFVMWDEKIYKHYGVPNTADGYVNRFLPLMQQVAKEVSRKDAERCLTSCSHSLPKVLDEYNFMVSR